MVLVMLFIFLFILQIELNIELKNNKTCSKHKKNIATNVIDRNCSLNKKIKSHGKQ